MQLTAGQWQLCDMQTAEGKPAQGPVASEFAAMFTYAVLPTLRKAYYDPAADGDLGNWEKYTQECANFATELGIPEQERHRITLPFGFSIDWDNRHTWMREVIATAGRCDALREACEHEALVRTAPELAKKKQGLEKSVKDAQQIVDDLELKIQEAEGQPAVAQLQIDLAYAELDRRDFAARLSRTHSAVEQHLRRRYAAKRTDLYLHEYFVKSQADCRFITITLEQIMPLSKVSPEVHCPIEHLVGTIKGCITADFNSGRKSDEELVQGRTYQEFINNAVAAKGNGTDGQHHISGSIEKQEIICKILMAKKGQRFTVDYTFGPPRADGQKDTHEVVGTAGNWIQDHKWT